MKIVIHANNKKTFLGAFQKTRSNSKKVNMEDIIDIHFGELSGLR